MAYIRMDGAHPADIVNVFSESPKLKQAFLDFSYVTTFGGSTLGRRREEMLSAYVSYLNRCFY